MQNNNKISRRKIIRDIGIGTMSITALGSGSVAAENRSDDPAEDGDVEPEAITNATTRWDPFEVNAGNSSTLNSTWSVTECCYSNYSFDILVDAELVSRPRWVATNLSTGSIDKNWVYESNVNENGINGPAYVFKATERIFSPFGTEIYVDSVVDTYAAGECTSLTGSYGIINKDFSGANLRIE
jgi:hypothetical protein